MSHMRVGFGSLDPIIGPSGLIQDWHVEFGSGSLDPITTKCARLYNLCVSGLGHLT
jgi:hypothetical protein